MSRWVYRRVSLYIITGGYDQENQQRIGQVFTVPSFNNCKTRTGEEIYQKYGLDSMEVIEEVFESLNSIIFDQVENRPHTNEAVMCSLSPLTDP